MKRVKELDRIVNAVNSMRMSQADHTAVADLETVQPGEGEYAWLFNPILINSWTTGLHSSSAPMASYWHWR